jgi:hypothetical protein
MDLKTLYLVCVIAFAFLVIISFLNSQRRLSAVPGSHQRYVAATVGVLCYFALFVAAVCVCVIAWMLSYYESVVLYALLALLQLLLLKRCWNDDNWFNDQWKRLKRGFKKLRQRITSASPLPLPSPA